MPLLKKHTLRLGEQLVHMGLPEAAGRKPDEELFGAAPNVSPVEMYAEPSEPLVSAEEREQVIQNILQEGKAQADAEAAQIKQKAEEEARQIIDAAEHKAKELLEKEIAKGVEEGRQKIYEQLKGHIAEAQNTVKQANAQKNAIIKSAVPEIMKLSTRIAAQVVRNELAQSQDIVMDIVKDAIEKISDNEQVVIKVAAQDLQAVRNEKELIIDLVEAKNLSIVPDKHCAEGGCVIETKLGFIDAKVVTKLDMIQTALLGVYREEKTKRETALKEAVERGEEIDLAAEEQKDIEELMQVTSLEEIREQEKKMLEEQQEKAKAEGSAEGAPEL
jgi:flagellar assembly protein FliH